MPIWIVDAHPQYQAGLNVEQVAREGYSALIVKATQGATGYTAPNTFDDWIRRARSAGMTPGAYHWITSASAASQVDHFLSRLDAVGGPNGLLCAVDVEDPTNPPSRATVSAWVAEWNRRTGNHPLVLYTGDWWRQRGWPGAQLTPYLWLSHYVSGTGAGSSLYAKVPASWWTPGFGGWGTATILQFSSTALVAGKSVDVSAFRGSLDELRALTTTTTEDDMTPEQDARLRTIERLVTNVERIDTCEMEGTETIPGLSYAAGQIEPDKTSVPLVRLRTTAEAVTRLETEVSTLRTELADLKASVAPPDPAAIAREIIALLSDAHS